LTIGMLPTSFFATIVSCEPIIVMIPIRLNYRKTINQESQEIRSLSLY
jgi:hypothetical protein